MVAVITSPHLLDVVVCSAVIVVVASTQKEFAGSIEEANCAVN
jgi:ABC-type cobalt transport system substrate-binding protein